MFPANDPKLAGELKELRAESGPALPILIGGRAAPAYQEAIDSIGARVVSDLGDLYASLANISQDRPAA